MSIATVVTMGFGSFGSVNNLPTLGFTIGAEVQPLIGCIKAMDAFAAGVAVAGHHVPGVLVSGHYTPGTTAISHYTPGVTMSDHFTPGVVKAGICQ
jgi:hypothetical protein